MGFFDRFRRDVRKDHLLIAADGEIPIEHIDAWSATKKIDYAWEVYNSSKDKYTVDHKAGALEFLRRQFKIPKEVSQEEQLRLIDAGVKLKTDLHIPSYAELMLPKPEATPLPTPVIVNPTPLPTPRPEPEHLPTTPMKKLKDVTWPSRSNESVKRFLESINKDVEQLNLLIGRYNTTRGKTKQIELLQQIYAQRQAIENKHSGEFIAACPSYREEIQSKLFNEMRQQLSNVGVLSMNDILKVNTASPATPTSKKSVGSFSEVLANMSPEKVSSLLYMLLKGPNFRAAELGSLYSRGEPGYKEFKDFLDKNDIEFLGGGNSKNFKIKPHDGSPSYVLKVDNRMGMPKGAEAHLRTHSLQETFTPVEAERQACAFADRELVARSVLVTEFCSGGDIESHGHQPKTDSQRIADAVNIYGQMGRILEGIRKDGCSFPDMKNTNWLIDEHCIVRLADTKSFLFTDERGYIDNAKVERDWYGLLSTGYMNPPEFNTLETTPVSADKMHAFMLGKNLYQYVSNCKWRDLYGHDSAADFSFSQPAFKTEEGRMLKGLIEGLIKPNPGDRLTVAQALQKLEQINVFSLKKECQAILNDFKKANIPEFKTFIAEQERQLSRLNTATDLTALKASLVIKKEESIAQLKEQCSADLKEIKRTGRPIDRLFITQSEAALSKASSFEHLLGIKEQLAHKQQEILTEKQGECTKILNDIKALGFGKDDKHMEHYVKTQMAKIDSATSSEELNERKNELKAKLKELDIPATKEIRTIIQSFRDKASLFTVGMKDKAQRIETAMSMVPLAERGNILEGNSAALIKVREELASHRHLHKQTLYKTEDGKLDENKAASSYTDFKKQLTSMRASAEQPQSVNPRSEEELDVSPSLTSK